MSTEQDSNPTSKADSLSLVDFVRIERPGAGDVVLSLFEDNIANDRLEPTLVIERTVDGAFSKRLTGNYRELYPVWRKLMQDYALDTSREQADLSALLSRPEVEVRVNTTISGRETAERLEAAGLEVVRWQGPDPRGRK
jgi:hypothetical protein